MGGFRPRSYPIRKITETAQRVGRIFQALRYPEQGGFTARVPDIPASMPHCCCANSKEF